MCGIAGLLVYESGGLPRGQTPREVVERMVGALGHRGPDDRGVEVVRTAPCVVLGNTRLAILDLSPAGHQPMADPETGSWIVHNGEVYNFRALRAELPRRDRRSETDTEAVLRAYGTWGKACVERFRGMFAFAIWDARRRELFLARDRFGIKPLYYYLGEGFFLFASEVRALLASGLVPRRLDPVGLWQYLGYQSVPPPRTLIEGVRSLPPGHTLTVSADAGRPCRVERYWDLWERTSVEEIADCGLRIANCELRIVNCESRIADLEQGSSSSPAPSPEAVRRRVRELLLEAVELELVSDVPVGIFLSGGIDSGAVAALVRALGRVPETFSVVLPDPRYDEAPYSRTLARRLGAEHTEVVLEERDLVEQLPEALQAMDHPTGDGINTYVISRAVRRAGYKVALSGLGGDELFGGYPSFARLRNPWWTLLGRVPRTARRWAAGILRALGRGSIRAEKAARLLICGGTLPEAYPLMRQVFPEARRRALLQPVWWEAACTEPDPYVRLLAEAFGPYLDGRSKNVTRRAVTCFGLLRAISYAEARTYMHDVLLRDTDQMSMAHGLEVRVPLLDYKLAEYVVGLPDRYKLPDGTPKRLLVESLEGLLPEEIVRRPKQGFVLPFEPWMRGALRPFCEKRLERLGERGIFRPEALRGLWEAFLAGRRTTSWSRVWTLVALDEWLERNRIDT